MLKKQLIELGLTKYEVGAYLCIIQKGITEASIIYKEAEIPYGKIYETLNSLVRKGLLEVQNVRPKKYMAKNPKLALKKFYSAVEKQKEEELDSTRKLITNIGDAIDVVSIKTPEKSFWKTAMDEEIYEMITSNFEEAEKEVCILLYPHKSMDKNSNFHSDEKDDFSLTQTEMMKAFSRGIKLRILTSKEMMLMHEPSKETTKAEKEMMKNIEMRFSEKPFPAYFTIIDDDKVVFSIIDPVEQQSIIAMTKVWDQRLAKKLKGKFETMWRQAKD